MSGLKRVRAFAGATVANVSCAFDILGFALNEPGDEVVVTREPSPGVTIVEITGDGGKLPRDSAQNTAGIALLSFLKKLGAQEGVSLSLKKGMPLGSGLGSSAASAVAALAAVNELFGRPFTSNELLPFALDGEEAACGARHADNVAPALFGGFVLIRSTDPVDVIPLTEFPPLAAAVWHPHVEVKTSDARRVLKREVPLSFAVKHWGNVAGLITGLFRGDYQLISRSLEDLIIEPERSLLIPDFARVRAAALEAGAIGCGISGSGPSVFALCHDISEGRRISDAMRAASLLGSDIFVSKVNRSGPVILEVS